MKLFAARAVDYPDMVALWPLCDFDSAADAVQRYYAAYPTAPDDEFLIDYVREIAERASG